MKKLFLLLFVLFSMPIFCMDEEGPSRSEFNLPEIDISNVPHKINNVDFKINNPNIIFQPSRRQRSFSERSIDAWNQGVDQVIAQLPILIASALINEALNGFPVCSKITELWNENNNQKNELDRLAPQFSSIQDTDAKIQILKQLITRLENEMDPEDLEQQSKLEELKKIQKECVNDLFDKTLKFEKLIQKEGAASAA